MILEALVGVPLALMAGGAAVANFASSSKTHVYDPDRYTEESRNDDDEEEDKEESDITMQSVRLAQLPRYDGGGGGSAMSRHEQHLMLLGHHPSQQQQQPQPAFNPFGAPPANLGQPHLQAHNRTPDRAPESHRFAAFHDVAAGPPGPDGGGGGGGALQQTFHISPDQGAEFLTTAVGRPADASMYPQGTAPGSVHSVPVRTSVRRHGHPAPEPFFTSGMPELHGPTEGRTAPAFERGSNPVEHAQRQAHLHNHTRNQESQIMTTPDGRKFRVFSERMPPPHVGGKHTGWNPTYDWVPQPKQQGELEQGIPTYGVDPNESWRLAMRMEMEKDALHSTKHNFNGDFYDGVGPQPEDSELPAGYCGYQRYGPFTLHVPETNQGFNDPLNYKDSAERDDIAWGPMATKELTTNQSAAARHEPQEAHVESMEKVELTIIDESTLPQNRSNPIGVMDRAVPLPDVIRPDVATYESTQTPLDGIETKEMVGEFERQGANPTGHLETNYGRSTWNPNGVYPLEPHFDSHGGQWALDGGKTEVGGYQSNGSVENVTGGQTHMGYKAQMREPIPTQEVGPQRFTPATGVQVDRGHEGQTWDNASIKPTMVVRPQDQTMEFAGDTPVHELEQMPFDHATNNMNSVEYETHLI